MPRLWVVNASPIILLGKIDRLELLFDLTDRIFVPKAVIDEVRARPEGTGWIGVLGESEGTELAAEYFVDQQVARWDLGAGETAVLSEAPRVCADRVVLDDLAARRCAKTLGVPTIGTLGIVIRAKRSGALPEARPVVDELRAAGMYASDTLVEAGLRRVGE